MRPHPAGRSRRVFAPDRSRRPARAGARTGSPSHRAALAAKLPRGRGRRPARARRAAPGGRGQRTAPNSSFWYLTGFPEPDAIAVLRPSAPEGKRYVFFVRPNEWREEQWTGRRAGLEGAKSLYGADASFPVADFEKETRETFAGREGALLSRRGRREVPRAADHALEPDRPRWAPESLPATDRLRARRARCAS